MRRQLLPSIGMVVLFTVVLGLLYPLAMTGIGQALFSDKADGSQIVRDGEVVGSKLLAQSFTKPEYFHSRPSASDYSAEPTSAHGSNDGPTSDRLKESVEERVAAYREENGLAADSQVPVDAVTASSSGLDPAISVANARLQAPRVAKARGLAEAQVLDLVEDHTTGRSVGVLGEATVNVLELNIALDDVVAK